MENQEPSILIVDDDPAMGQMLASMLGDSGYQQTVATSAQEALEAARHEDFDAVLSDIKMPGGSGVELVGQLREIRAGTPVVLMTAFGSIDSAVDAMRAGAFDYVTKPFRRGEITVVMDRALEHRALELENRRLRAAVDKTTAVGDLKGESAAMREIFSLVRKVANSSSSVLITGESGTGKEVVARTLHFSGNRKDAAFVPVNCTAIPEGLLESELFGHVRGAFTGASASKKGLFEKANSGTLFLDEIGDMPLSLQSKLLRVLQDGEIRPVGGTTTTKVDVRIVSATHQDLREQIKVGKFRQDLFYRLDVIPVHIPPLRSRPEDIMRLAQLFLERHAPGERRTLSDGAMRALGRCSWEGNARELENVIERSLAVSDKSELEPDDLLLPSGEVDTSRDESAKDPLDFALSAQLTLRELEALYTKRVLLQTKGNKLQAAKLLGINRRTLYRRGEA
ncbi:MAG TPA: sigma-54-dependent Fis family transcriptional regulator [Myxococcales bacterium]|nr:sigma-54-dependent Fis family transcriptional regulator [Myxococcales bacterium]